jgi:CheY-like chemotaxis protein/HPt (histidine-containing phosphotransfer) domain-containing protein
MSELLMTVEDDTKQKEYVRIIRSSSASLLDLLNDILDLSKIDSGKLDMKNVQFNLQDVIDNLADLFLERNLAKGLELIVDIRSDVPEILTGDPLRLRQVIANLVANAFKFTEKGEICISVEVKGVDKQGIELLFCIKDTGIGIDNALFENDVNDLFGAFNQLENPFSARYGGAGLGLAICRKIVTMMRGRIWVESTPGVGSSFFFTACFDHHIQKSRSKPIVPSRIENHKVLIIEDNPSTLMVIKRYLESFGFRVDMATSAEDGLVQYELALSIEPYRLILMDIHLPGMDGIAAARKIKEKNPAEAPPIIMMSSTGTEKDISLARKAGSDSFLLKPIKPSLLFDTIMELYGYEPQKMKISRTLSESEAFPDIRLLLVEDNSINQMVVTEMLQLPGITIDLANNGQEAIECIQKETYSAILMDVQMPGMDGLETTRIIRNKLMLTDIPIIAMTAHAMYGDREKCLAAGMNDYIPKPVDRERLIAVLKLHLNTTPPDHDDVPPPLPGTMNPMETGTSTLPGIDLDEGLKRFGDSWIRYMKILTSFNTNFTDFSASVAKAIAASRPEDALIQAHSLKGTAGNISANRLYFAADAFEKALRTGSPADIENCFERVDDELKIVLESIQRVTCAEPHGKSMAKTDKERFRPDIIIGMIPELKGTLKDFDPVESETKLEKIKKCFFTHKSRHDLENLVNDLENHVKNYEFDEAIVVLEHLEDQLKTI